MSGGVRQEGPICVSVINLKGGVGKTTIAALLGRHAVTDLGLNVLAIDLDPQANLSQAYMRATYQQFIESSRPSIVEVFSGMHPPVPGKPSPTKLKIEDAVVRVLPRRVIPIQAPRLTSRRRAVHVIPRRKSGCLDLIPSRFDFSNHLTESLKPDERVLAKCIAEHFKEKDLVLIDCAPTESVFTTAAYHASRFVLVPVMPEFFATIGFPLLQQSLERFRQKNRGHKIDVVGIAINNAFYDGGNDGGPEKTKSMKDIRQEAKRNEWTLFKNEIPHSRGFPKQMRGDDRHPGNSVRFSDFAWGSR